jgi:hypothetical protein
MAALPDIQELQRANKKLRSQIIEQTRVFEEERAKILAVNRRLQAALQKEQLRSQATIEQLTTRIAELEAETCRVQMKTSSAYLPTSTSTRKDDGRTITFSDLETETQRLLATTNRMLHQDEAFQIAPKVRKSRADRPFPQEKPFVPPPVVSNSSSTSEARKSEIEEPKQDEFLFPETQPITSTVKAAPDAKAQPVKPVRDAAAQKPAVETISSPPRSTFQPHLISAQSSITDDFFDAIASPTPEAQVPATAPSQTRPVKNPPPARRVQSAQSESGDSSVADDLFGDLGDLDIVMAPPKATPKGKGSVKTTPKQAAVRSAPKASPVKEQNSADQFEVNEDDIHFDFDGRDPFA